MRRLWAVANTCRRQRAFESLSVALVLPQATGSLASLVPGSANIPLLGGSNTPVVGNPNYVPPPGTAANNTDDNTNNNYQRVTGDNNVVVGKEVNTTVAQVQACLLHHENRSLSNPAPS